MSFDYLSKKISDKRVLIFLDLEGTQFSHTPIEIGMVAYLKGDGLFLGEKLFTYQSYINTNGRIGKVVSDLTGITKELLLNKGKSKTIVLKEIINLLRAYSKKKFIAYGEQDLKMLRHFITEESFTSDYVNHIAKNYFDFHLYLANLISKNKSISPSLSKLTELFDVPKSHAHESLSDAQMLADVYQEFVKDESTTINKIKSMYSEIDEERLRKFL